MTVISTGTCTIQARQAGNQSFFPATSVTRSFKVTGVQAALTVGATLTSIAVNGTSTLLVVGGSGTGAVSFAVTAGGSFCSLTGTTLTGTGVGVGTCTVTATKAADANFAAISDTVDVTVGPAAQAINFTNPGAQTFTAGGTVPLTVIGGGSGNAVTLASTTAGVCTVAGSTVTMVSVGTCTITADQTAGNGFSAATQVTENFVIGQGVNTITFTGPADTLLTSSQVTVAATSSSGLAVSFASTTAGVCTVSGTTVTLVSVGTCSITASQAGDSKFVAAADVAQSFAIGGEQTITKTKAIASNFVSGRAGRILNGTPNIASRLSRSGGGSSSGPTGFSPFGFSGGGTFDNAKMAFSTSLRQVIDAGNAGNDAQRQKLGEMMALGEQSLLTQYNTGLQPGFDIWIKGSLDHANSDSRKLDLGLLFIGADYHLSETTLVGVLAQFDWSNEKDRTNSFTTDGNGWMIGPYLATRLGENLLFDGRVAYGQSSNRISPLGTYEDSFDTTRALISGTLTCDFNMGSWRFSPHAGVSYFEETQKAYTDSIGNNITEQTISLGSMTFGPEVSTSFKTSDGTVISPHIGVKGIWDFDKAQTIDLTTGVASGSENELRASMEAGLTTRFHNGWRLSGEGHYDGIGDDSLEAYGGSLKLTVPLN